MIETTLMKVHNNVGELRQVMDHELRVDIGFKLSKIMRVVADHMQEYQKYRIQLVEEYGVNVEGDVYEIPNDDQETLDVYYAKLNEYLENDIITIDEDKIKIDDLRDVNGELVFVQASAFFQLDWLFEE